MNIDGTQRAEIDLVDALKAGESAAYAFLYESYSATLLGILLHLVDDKEKAEDLLHDAFIKIWTTIHRYDPERGRLFTWLQAVTRNLAISQLRADKNHSEIQFNNLEQASDRTYQPSQGGIPNQSLFDLLTPKYRQIIVLVCQGYTEPEVAELLKLPFGTVKTWRRMGMQELKQILRQDILHFRKG